MSTLFEKSGMRSDAETSGDKLSVDHQINDVSKKLQSEGTHTVTPEAASATEVSISEGREVEGQIPNPNEDVTTPPPVKVPRSQRRGLLGRYTLLAEVEEPKHYARSTKWFLTFVVASAAVAAPLGSAIFFPSLLQVSEELQTTTTITNLSIALYMLSMSIFPLWWSSFSETLGRRTIYIISFSMFVVWSVLSAFSQNIAWLIVMRVLSGGAAASVQAVGAGTIADIWEVRERGKAMGIFYLGPLMGPLFAPIIGGALAIRWGWRSTQWFLVIYGGTVLILLILALPETLKTERYLAKEAEKEVTVSTKIRPSLTRVSSIRDVSLKRTTKQLRLLKRSLVDPLSIILYLRFPAVLITVYYASITFGCLYILNISLEATFAKPPYNFTTFDIGLTYIPNSIGYILSSLIGGRWTDKIMAREARKAGRYDEHGKLIYRPEDRMRENAWIAAFMYPAALIWYGWAIEKGAHWIVPLVANFFFGVGSMLIFSVSTTMLTEFMPKKASSGVAINNFVRNILSCIGGVVAQPLINTIGNGWLFTGLGVIAAASSAVVWAMRHYGPHWREDMDKKMR